MPSDPTSGSRTSAYRPYTNVRRPGGSPDYEPTYRVLVHRKHEQLPGSATRLDYVYRDDYVGEEGDPHPVVRIKAINFSSLSPTKAVDRRHGRRTSDASDTGVVVPESEKPLNGAASRDSVGQFPIAVAPGRMTPFPRGLYRRPGPTVRGATVLPCRQRCTGRVERATGVWSVGRPA